MAKLPPLPEKVESGQNSGDQIMIPKTIIGETLRSSAVEGIKSRLVINYIAPFGEPLSLDLQNPIFLLDVE